ncbi:SMEK domain-containing protein [Dysgonomonas capnocytophagoides]|uniref:SMEK domain-containing protein n=1 Tax=Dysgonomonas capnocytophagoides TaxID=45254 RepID=UPI00399376A6
MDVRDNAIKNITKKLAYLQSQISLSNSLNLTDINIHAENFYRDFFNNCFGYSFKNTNFDHQNAAHIDLIDNSNNYAIQVTSQNDNAKITSAIEGFYTKDEYKNYKLDILLISKDAKDYTTDFTKKGKYSFDHATQVKDIKRLIAEINNKNLQEIQKIESFLNEQILTEREPCESTEVETIMSLVYYLSTERNRTPISSEQYLIDPNHKINTRFADHADFIKEQYKSLHSIYQNALKEAKLGIDAVNVIIISSYLQEESNILLHKHNNNPRLALDEMVTFFYDKLSSNGFKGFDKMAIKYYLLDELIMCNVFPNKKAVC